MLMLDTILSETMNVELGRQLQRFMEKAEEDEIHKPLILNIGNVACLRNHSFRRLPMFRFFLFMAGVMVASACTAREVSQCTANTVPIQIMTPASSGNEIKHFAAEISDKSSPHFRALVTAVTERINSRLAKDKLCVTEAKSMESMRIATAWNRSLLQFVHWRLDMHKEYLVPVLTSMGGLPPPSCRISSPWIDLTVYRAPIPHVTQASQVRGIVRWNERQLLADQAILAGAKNVPLGMAMPLSPSELDHFVREIRRKSEAKPVEARVPPDILWLLRSLVGKKYAADEGDIAGFSMYGVTKNGAAGYTKLVLALIDRCFASDGANLRYNSILDVADPVLRKQYKIDTPIR